jgi:hypothetical protein
MDVIDLIGENNCERVWGWRAFWENDRKCTGVFDIFI